MVLVILAGRAEFSPGGRQRNPRVCEEARGQREDDERVLHNGWQRGAKVRGRATLQALFVSLEGNGLAEAGLGKDAQGGGS